MPESKRQAKPARYGILATSPCTKGNEERMKRALSAILLILLLAAPATADPQPTAEVKPRMVPPAALKEMGMRTLALRLAAISNDGQVTVLSEKERDARLKAKGLVWKLRVFRFEGKSATPRLLTIPLPTMDYSQIGIAPDGSSALVISDKGTRLIGVDLKKGVAHVIFRHARGDRSFRVTPELVWFEKGRFHTLGYFMDANGVTQEDAVVAVDVAGRGLWAINKVADITEMVRRVKGFRQCTWHSVDQKYYIFADPTPGGKQRLGAYFGDRRYAVEEADSFGAIASGAGRILYPARVGNKRILAVADILKDKRWPVANGDVDFEYPYISADGKTIVACTFNIKKELMTAFYGHESDNFSLHPVQGLSELPMGTLRMSPDGRVLALYNERGLHWYRLPAASAAAPKPQK